MDHAPLPDLDALDRDALLDLIRAHEQQFASLIAAQDEEIRRLEAELDAHRQTMSEQAEELDLRRERIEHVETVRDTVRHGEVEIEQSTARQPAHRLRLHERA